MRQAGSVKTGGRKKGTPNKKTCFLSKELAKNNLNVIEQLSFLFPELSDDKKADVLLKLMEYLYPKRKPIDAIVGSEDEKIIVNLTIPHNGREGLDSGK